MLNLIWLFLLLAAVFIGGFSGRMDAVSASAAESAKAAVMSVALPLAGWFALWLGMLRLAELSGLVRAMARALRPVLRRLFPDVPKEDPALGAMALNMAANMLGLGNAATPLGLKAMKHLERLNPRPGLASNAMCTFLAINTASIQLIPATAIGILAINGSANPTAIIPSALLATVCAFSAGLLCVKLLEKLPRYRLPAPSPQEPQEAAAPATPAKPEEPGAPIAAETAPAAPLSLEGRFALALYGLAFLALFYVLAFPQTATALFASLNKVLPNIIPAFRFSAPDGGLGPLSLPLRLLNVAALLGLPFAFTFFPLYAHLRGVKVYEEFVEGAKEGFQVTLRIIPFLVAILVAVGMFRAAGGIELLARALGPFLAKIGFPVDLLPLVLVRPLSGGAATGVFTELVRAFGPDSLISRMAATICGSTETTFYVLAVYFGSVGIRRPRHALWAGLTADLAGVIASILVCRWLFV